MASIEFIQPERPVPEVPSGRSRKSITVDSKEFDVIRRRQALNERLLDGTCGFDRGIQDEARFGPDDLELLLVVSRERFGAESAVLRRQAVLALGQVRSDDALRRLIELALSPLEHDGIRISAITALGPDRKEDLLRLLVDDPSPVVREHVQRLIEDKRVERRFRPGEVPRDRDVHEVIEDPFEGRVPRPTDPC